MAEQTASEVISDDGLRQCRGRLGGDTLDVILQYLVGWLRHGPVVVALHLVERHVLMAHELQHAPEVGLLLIAAIEFQLPVAGDDDDGRCVGTDVDVLPREGFPRRGHVPTPICGISKPLFSFIVYENNSYSQKMVQI